MFSGHLVSIKCVSHHIELNPGNCPILQQPYRAGPQHQELIEELVTKMFACKVTKTAKSDCASPIVISLKNYGTPMFCVDYRKSNEVNIPDSDPISRMDDCIDILGYSTVYSVHNSNWG